MPEMLPADWALAAFVVSMTVMGLFRGFSGTLAFMIALALAGVTAFHVWDLSLNFTDVLWMRGAIVLISTLLAFGIVRVIIKKLVNGLLSQPADAIFGAIAGLAAALLVIFAWAHTAFHLEYSNIATEVSRHVR